MEFKPMGWPLAEPLSLADVKAALRIDGDEDDAMLNRMITAARELAEAFTRRTFITTQFIGVLDASPDGPLYLPRTPLRTLDKIEVIDAQGVTTEVPTSDYMVDAVGGRVQLVEGSSWPDHRGFASFLVTWTAGMGNTIFDVPAGVKQGLLQTIGTLYENRTDVAVGNIVQELPLNAQALLAPFVAPRRRRIG